MTEDQAAETIAQDVGLSGSWGPAGIDTLAREASAARRRGDWPADLNWRAAPKTAGRRIILYLNSFK